MFASTSASFKFTRKFMPRDSYKAGMVNYAISELALKVLDDFRLLIFPYLKTAIEKNNRTINNHAKKPKGVVHLYSV